MKLPRVLSLCRAMPGATEDIKWGNSTVFAVGRKIFAISSPDGPFGTLAFKVDDSRFLELTDRPGVIPAPYLARAKWISVSDPHTFDDNTLDQLLERSYQLVFAKLTKKLQREISGAAH
jgi:predicted DNA-binding protein (MmcQ/YjbR family)